MERKHRYLLNVARALRFQAHLPLKFWGEHILTACYLINRLTTLLLSYKTPYERFHKEPPSYSHLQVYGCPCFVTNLTTNHKFDTRARRCIFLGYPLGQKGYRVYDLVGKKMFTSRDVIFHKNIFHFSNIPHDDDNNIPTLPKSFDIGIATPITTTPENDTNPPPNTQIHYKTNLRTTFLPLPIN